MEDEMKDCDCEGDYLSTNNTVGNHNKKIFSFMTWNLFIGADLSPLFSTAILEEVPRRVTEVYRQFLATNFPERVKIIAQQIARVKPDLIGLQEAALWQLRQLMSPGGSDVTIDYIKLLLDELQKKGIDYEVAACNKNISVQLRSSQGNFVRLLDRDTILIRKDSGLKIIDKEESNFKTHLVRTLGGQRFEILRGWSRVDVSINDTIFRVVSTRLEATSSLVNRRQGNELLEGPANTNFPIILLGDLNVNNASAPPNSYRHFLHAGFQDVWTEAGQGEGFTCCQDSDLLNAYSTLNRRIDCILYRNGWKPIKASIIGAEQQDRTQTALWTSDHAGIIADFEV